MTFSDEGDEPLSPAERRLSEHLELIRASPPERASLAHRVVRAARVQRALREPLEAISAILGAFGDCLAGLLGIHRRGQR